jgi:hypothetical protein
MFMKGLQEDEIVIYLFRVLGKIELINFIDLT